MSQMSHESRYESLRGFSLKVRTRVRFRVRIRVGFSDRVGVRLRVTGVFFLRLNILTCDSLTYDSLKLQFLC